MKCINMLENVIKGLECCIKVDEGGRCSGDCPYYDDNNEMCLKTVKMVAIAVIREQEKEINRLTTELQKWEDR